jgi:hypothetical protein
LFLFTLQYHGIDMIEPNAPPVSIAENEPNSGFSYDEGGSSGDDTSQNGPASTAFAGNKRKRTKYQKTS